jgi:hypothetical protein
MARVCVLGLSLREQSVKQALAALAFLLPSLCCGGEDWSTVDKVTATGAGIALFYDWGQTQNARRTFPGHEDNKFLGSSPSAARVNAYFIGSSLLVFGVGSVLPSGARSVWFSGTIFVEMQAIQANKGLGIAFRIPI